MASIDTRLAREAFDPADEFSAFQQGLAGEGAVVTFAGHARPDAHDGGVLQHLFLDHHPRLTPASLLHIAEDAAARFDITRVRVVHRCGAIGPGEAIVFVATAALHRRPAFEAADYLMDRLKTDAVFWKREDAPGTSRWIEPTPADRAERARWS